jgi:hypothetical protein
MNLTDEQIDPVIFEHVDEALWKRELTKLRTFARDLLALAAARAEPDPWQQAIDDAMVSAHLGVAEGDARECLRRLIAWHEMVALDPAVSSEAQALIERGRAAPEPAELAAEIRRLAQLMSTQDVAAAMSERRPTRAVLDAARQAERDFEAAVDRLAALATQAQPATHAEVLTDEREAFEAWAVSAKQARREADGGIYSPLGVEGLWRAWQARAAIATQAAQQPKDMGVPASPSGSPLQPPSSASAAIPDAACDNLSASEQQSLAIAIFDWLCRKYVQRADDRHRAMGLQYTEAETHDLAEEIARQVATWARQGA